MKLVYDIWWTSFCQEPKLFLKLNKVCKMWKDWDINTNWSQDEKQWIWKHICWLGNTLCFQKWGDLDVPYINTNNWYYMFIAVKWNYGLMKACQSGNIDLVNYMIEKGAYNWNNGLYGACQGGNIDLVNYMIEKIEKEADNFHDESIINRFENGLVRAGILGVCNFNDGLHGACRGGNIDLVNLMIEKGADDWDWGLSGACIGGNIDLVNLMIEKGADDWNLGLSAAWRGGHHELVDLMTDKGATNGHYFRERSRSECVN